MQTRIWRSRTGIPTKIALEDQAGGLDAYLLRVLALQQAATEAS